MRTIEPSKLTNEQLARVDEFMKVAVLLKDDEIQAIDKQIPMTQDLFDRLCDRLSEIGAQNEFFRLLSEYPDFLMASGKEIENEIELSNIELPEMTDEKYSEIYEGIMQKIGQGF